MKYSISAIIFFACTLPAFTQQKNIRPKEAKEMCWWYDKPATKYWEGLPIATGRFAAMIGGKIGQEDIVFNDETLWSGGPYDPNNLNGPRYSCQRKKICAGKRLCTSYRRSPEVEQHTYKCAALPANGYPEYCF